MKKWTKFSLAGSGLVGTGIGLTLWTGVSRWNSETTRLIEKLKQSATVSQTKTVSFKDLDGLPAPVARYFRFALREGQSIIRVARIRHTGEFNLNNKWIPFESLQHFSSYPPAFVWDAKMQMNPLMNVRVRNGYSEGKGLMLAKVFGLFTVADADSNDKRLASGALIRFLAESAWLPLALLQNEDLKWSSIDDNRALATLADAGVAVNRRVNFSDNRFNNSEPRQKCC